VPVYPGYVCAIAGSIVTGKPVKWIEDRSENLMSTGFARDYIMRGEIAATKDGKITRPAVNVLADHGAFDSHRAADQVPGRVLPHLLRLVRPRGRARKVKAVYTNKAPGGVAYRCSFRITEAVYLVERMVDASRTR
jgi:carbon-monoxide dehydrogenase large subunit